MKREFICEPVRCVECGATIRCGDECKDRNSRNGPYGDYGFHPPDHRWLCNRCSGGGRWRIYHCSSACYWRHRRARLRAVVKPRKCAACGKKFTPRRSDAKACSNACRQALFRRRTTGA
jgi:hypothetical protein